MSYTSKYLFFLASISASAKPFAQIVSVSPYNKLTACPYCMPSPRKEALEEINRIHLETSPGEVMTVYSEKKKK